MFVAVSENASGSSQTPLPPTRYLEIPFRSSFGPRCPRPIELLQTVGEKLSPQIQSWPFCEGIVRRSRCSCLILGSAWRHRPRGILPDEELRAFLNGIARVPLPNPSAALAPNP